MAGEMNYPYIPTLITRERLTADDSGSLAILFFEASGGGAVTINAPVATATAQAYAPTISVSIAAPLSTATATAPTPTIKITVNAPVSTATALAPTPTLKTTVNAPVSTATALAPTPGIAVTINAPTATASASAPSPTLKLTINVPFPKNYMPNPRVDNGASWWSDENAAGGGSAFATITQSTDQAYIGTHSAKHVVTADGELAGSTSTFLATDGTFAFASAPSNAGDTVVSSVWIYPTGSLIGGYAALIGQSPTLLTSGWQQLTGSFVLDEGEEGTIYDRVRVARDNTFTTIITGDTFYLADAYLGLNDALPAGGFADGDTPGWFWSGTPHDSASVQAGAYATAPVPTIVIGSGGGAVTVNAPVATATAQAYAPTLNVTLNAPTATASASAPTPTLKFTIAAPTATATATAQAPAPKVTIFAPVATASAQAFAPTLRLVLTAPTATATAQAFDPVVIIGEIVYGPVTFSVDSVPYTWATVDSVAYLTGDVDSVPYVYTVADNVPYLETDPDSVPYLVATVDSIQS